MPDLAAVDGSARYALTVGNGGASKRRTTAPIFVSDLIRRERQPQKYGGNNGSSFPAADDSARTPTDACAVGFL